MSRKDLIIVSLCVMVMMAYSIAAAGAGYFVQKKINVSCGNIKLFFNGAKVSDNLPVIVTEQGVAMIPARSVLNLLGNTVYWDEESHLIRVETEKKLSGRSWKAARGLKADPRLRIPIPG